MGSNTKNRNSTLELLRIVAGILIVIGHASSKGGGMLGTSGLNNVFAHTVALGANIGSNLLAIIGLYFMIGSKFKFKSWLRIWFFTIYYYFGIVLCDIILAERDISANMVFKGLPIIGRPYWFVTAYLLFMLFIPFLNYGMKKIPTNIIRKLVLISTIIFTVIPLFMTNSTIQNDLSFFLWLYLVVYWLFYCENRSWNQKVLVLSGVSIFLIIVLWGMIVQRIYIWDNQIVNVNIMTRLSERNSILSNILSFILFITFINKKPFYSSKVNLISKSVFSLYLFHCHPSIKNEIIWSVMKYAEYYDSVWFGLYTMALPILFLIIVLILDIPARILYEIITNNKWVKNWTGKIDCWLDFDNYIEEVVV